MYFLDMYPDHYSILHGKGIYFEPILLPTYNAQAWKCHCPWVIIKSEEEHP